MATGGVFQLMINQGPMDRLIYGQEHFINPKINIWCFIFFILAAYIIYILFTVEKKSNHIRSDNFRYVHY